MMSLAVPTTGRSILCSRLSRLAAGCTLLATLALGACDANSTTSPLFGEAAALDGSGSFSRARNQTTGKRVTVSPEAGTIEAVGQTLQLSVTVLNPAGRELPNPSVTWTSLDDSVATVDEEGLVTALAAGHTEIVVVSNMGEDTAQITVVGPDATAAEEGEDSSPRVALVAVAPDTVEVEAGSTLQLTATVEDEAGQPMDETNVVWSSSDPTVATVGADGRVSAKAAGNATVRATADGKSGSASVVVTAKPGSTAPPSGLYSPRTPHWSHIRTMITDFRIHHHALASTRSVEYDWTARHYDWVMGGNASEYATRNPTGTNLTYDVYLALTASRHEAARQWFAANGRNFEAAHLHSAEPRTASTRMKTTIWGSERHLMNVGNADYREYIAHLIRQHVSNGSNGVFWDEHETQNISRARGSVEYPNWADFQAAVVGALEHQRRSVPGAVVMVNSAEYTDEFMRRVIIAAGSTHLEFWNSPQRRMDTRWGWVEELTNAGVTVQVVDGMRDEDFDKIGSNFTRGNSATPADRARLFTLASFYMMQHPDVERTLYTNTNYWNRAFSEVWVGAVEVNVGRPRETRRRVALGTDPVGQPAVVFFREFENALMVVRSQADWEAKQYGDATAVPVTLPAGETWYPVDRHGKIGRPITTLHLRNGEGAILIKGSRGQ